MALQNYETILKEWENIIRVKLKVSNPSLLKSGALGILTNYFAGIKFDALEFYTKTFQEINVGLAQDFSSMLYHATVYGAEIEFANPATLSSSLVVPEINLAQVEELIYEIPRYTSFTDANGIPFITISDIKLTVTQRGIKAISWNSQGSKNLAVTKTTNPNVPNSYLYLVHNADIQQFKRNFYTFNVPAYNLGDSYTFTVGIPDVRQIKDIKVWLNTGTTKIDINMLENIGPEDLINLNDDGNLETDYNVIPLDIKYHKSDSSYRDDNIFLNIYEYSLQFETGNGINGKIPPEGSQIIVEVQTTLGENGNVSNSEFILPNVQVKEKLNGIDTYNSYTTNINGLSTTGATGGFNVPGVDKIRETIFNQISIRNSVITENDYERLFEYQNIKPFVDSKFIDAQAFVFLFNVIRDNDNIVLSNTFNIKEDFLFQEPFYPEIVYNGINLVSPFYYKNRNENEVDAYLVNPDVVFDLRPVIATEETFQYAVTNLKVSLQYDFTARKSYIKIVEGYDPNYEYHFKSSVFNCILNAANEYTWEVNTMFTDPYCIVRETIENIQLEIYDTVGAPGQYAPELLITFVTEESYNQLILKQTFYKFFEEKSENDLTTNYTSESTAYLDNSYNEIMSTTTDIFGESTDVFYDTYILRMPFIDRDYFYRQPSSDIFELMDQYFIVNYLKEDINYNTRLIQAFYNTIDLPPQYKPYLFEEEISSDINTPKLPISLEVFLNRDKFIVSEFENITDFEIALKIKLITFLKKCEGFMIEFFETDLEKYLFNEFSPIIRNIRVNSPEMFIVNNAGTIYNDMQNDLTFKEVLDFVPPYFYYDYNNIDLTIQM